MTQAKQRSKARRFTEWTLFVAGFILVGIWAASKIVPLVWQAHASRVFERALGAGPSPAAPPRAAGTPRLENGQLLGRLSIPRLHLTSMVREGDDETTLGLALGHIPSTALPGQAGNVGIAGHRDTIFRPLARIQKDDLIRFETLSGAHVYQVDSTRIVKPDDVAVLRSDGSPRLTLVTCYPFYYVGAAPDRFIVFAHEVPAARQQVSITPAAPAPPIPLRETSLPGDSLPGDRPAPVPARPAGFEIHKGQTREVAPGISLGLTDTDPRNASVYGWIWVTPDQRAVLLRAHPAGQPLVFYQAGRRRELRFTRVLPDSAVGNLSPPE